MVVTWKKSPNISALKVRATKDKARGQQQHQLKKELIKRLNFIIKNKLNQQLYKIQLECANKCNGYVAVYTNIN